MRSATLKSRDMRKMAIISVVDNDESVRMALDSLLRSNGYTVHTYSGAQEFFLSGGPALTSCLISDIQMPGMSGIEMYEQLSAMGLHMPVIFITGNPGAIRKVGLNVPEPIAFFPKPFAAGQLLAAVEMALNHPD